MLPIFSLCYLTLWSNKSSQAILFLSLYQPPTLYLLFFQHHEIFPKVPLMWSFIPALLPLGYLPIFCHHHVPHLCNHVLLTSSSDCIARVSNNGKVNNFFYFTYTQFRFHFQHYHSSFSWCTCILVGQILFLVSISLRCYLELSLGDKEVKQLHDLLSVLEKQVNRDQSPIQFARSTWLDSDDAHLLFM